MYRWIHKIWYEGSRWYIVLLPLSGLFWVLSGIRRTLYRWGWLPVRSLDIPLIVVGNITAGGTGKTPVTIWLSQQLKGRGYSPGIVSRGYGGSREGSSMRVDSESDTAVVGDEPVLIAKRTACPVVVDSDRSRAAIMLAEDGANVIIADDGLQHYGLARNYEICVIDGARGLGNRLLLPAGPLRELPDRLLKVDQVLVNGNCEDSESTAAEQNALCFELGAMEACRLNGSLSRPLQRFEGQTVHAVAAIGNPDRFFTLLRNLGIKVIEHAYRDHQVIDLQSLGFDDEFEVFMTEKDAVKVDSHAADRFWYVPVELQLDDTAAGPWLEQLDSRLKADE